MDEDVSGGPPGVSQGPGRALHTRPHLGAILGAKLPNPQISSRGSAGFTLIELIVVVAIIAILASGLLPLAELAAQRSREQELRLGLREIRTAIDAYKQATDEGRVMKQADQSGYPPSLDVLVSGVPDEKTPDKRKIYFLRRIPRDPFSDDANVPADKTWGLRSYQSAPDDPHEGDDVFDVYSKSTKRGLNGTAYKQW